MPADHREARERREHQIAERSRKLAHELGISLDRRAEDRIRDDARRRAEDAARRSSNGEK